MKFHMLMLMNAWMMLVLMKLKCQMQCLTLGCYKNHHLQTFASKHDQKIIKVDKGNMELARFEHLYI